MFFHKIIPFEKAPLLFQRLKKRGRKIVQCHGTFDLIHPGHIHHLEEAKSLGDILVATATDENHVNKGPGRPYFNDELRARTLSALECVDYVVMIPFTGAVEAIECVRPDIYCKGREYEDPAHDVTGRIHEDVAAVKRCGGRMSYVGDVVFSSTRLINQHLQPLPKPVREFCSKLADRFSPADVREAVEGFSKLRVLIIGDIIMDRYSYLTVQGLTSKNRIISGRYLREETQAGGALAVYRHVKQFTRNVKLVGLVGTEPWLRRDLRRFLDIRDDWLFRDAAFTTVVKQRFVEPLSEGKELSKLFAVNFLAAEQPRPALHRAILHRIEREIRRFDLVMVADFGHGLLQDQVRKLVQEKSPFLALNCQTNSANHGFNIISRQYQRVDAFSLDAQELLLSCGRRHIHFAGELSSLRRKLKSSYAWLTRGAVETIGLQAGGASCLCPPFENEVTDTVGAGDAFFSIASLAAKQKLPISLATFLGQLAGAQAVKIVGNSRPISKDKLLKGGMSLLNL